MTGVIPDSIKYTWKGNNLKAISFTHKDSNKGAYEPGEKHDRSRTKTYNMTASISKKKPKKMKESVKEVWKNKYEKGDNGTRSDSRSTTFKWNKKDGTALCENTYGDGGKDRRGSYITLKSGRRASDWADNMKATYYKDGKLKSIMITYGDGGYHKEEFNKNGYLTKTENSNKGYDENGRNKQYDSKEITTLTWKMSGKKPLSVEVSRQGTNMDGKWTDKFKWVFTKTMKVSKVRNCDAYGLPVGGGAE